jgi:hypothetical protein
MNEFRCWIIACYCFYCLLVLLSFLISQANKRIRRSLWNRLIPSLHCITWIWIWSKILWTASSASTSFSIAKLTWICDRLLKMKYVSCRWIVLFLLIWLSLLLWSSHLFCIVLFCIVLYCIVLYCMCFSSILYSLLGRGCITCWLSLARVWEYRYCTPILDQRHGVHFADVTGERRTGIHFNVYSLCSRFCGLISLSVFLFLFNLLGSYVCRL